jgi:hypothetical protein
MKLLLTGASGFVGQYVQIDMSVVHLPKRLDLSEHAAVTVIRPNSSRFAMSRALLLYNGTPAGKRQFPWKKAFGIYSTTGRNHCKDDARLITGQDGDRMRLMNGDLIDFSSMIRTMNNPRRRKSITWVPRALWIHLGISRFCPPRSPTSPWSKCWKPSASSSPRHVSIRLPLARCSGRFRITVNNRESVGLRESSGILLKLVNYLMSYNHHHTENVILKAL